jgi:ubiquinol-cytochrome c reductase iron-sulfur subunit
MEKNINRRKFLSIATSVTSAVGGIFALSAFVSSFQPSKKAKALGASIKVSLSNLEPGSIIKVIYRGKPIWVLRRTEKMISELEGENINLRDPESDLSIQPQFAKNKYRSKNPEYFVVEGVCTHLGCAPIEKFSISPADMGPDWKGGFYCPCHGSKFDLSGRVYAGVPAPSNLRVPAHQFIGENTLLVGENS